MGWALALLVLAALDPDVGAEVEVTLQDGQEFKGTLVERTAERAVVEVVNGTRLILPAAVIGSIARVHVPRRDDPYAPHYFFAHSDFLPRHGTWTLSVKELSAPFVTVGLLDVMSFELGTVTPLYAFGLTSCCFLGGPFDGANVMFSARGGGELVPGVHASTALQGFVLPLFTRGAGGIPVSGLISGSVTFGTPQVHGTLQVGLPFQLAGSAPTAQHLSNGPMVTVSAAVRLTERLSLMTENWVYFDFQDRSAWIVFNALGGRIAWQRFALGLGVLVTTSSQGPLTPVPVPLPLVDLLWSFD